MPIRVVPFESIDAPLIESLQTRRVREDRTLDFKRDLTLTERDQRSEFLKDVTAFANGSGGTLLYGVEEGKGEDEGIIVATPGVELASTDAVHRQVDETLRSGVDERIMGVLHRAVPRADGRYYYVVRVPPSPLAPHMVTVGKHTGRFFLRATTTTDVMDARQIKETALRATSAFDRAMAIIESRRQRLVDQAKRPPEEGGIVEHPTDDRSQLILHVVPLFPAPGGFALAEDAVVERLAALAPMGWSPDGLDRRFSLDGLHLTYSDVVRAAFLRSGAAEFQELRLLDTRLPSAALVRGWEIGQQVLRTLDECAGLTGDGLLPLPVVVSIALNGVRGSRLQTRARLSNLAPETLDLDAVPLTPVVLHGWDAVAAKQVRDIFDEMYQAWGLRRDVNYDASGRIWWGQSDRTAPPAPRFWSAVWSGGVEGTRAK